MVRRKRKKTRQEKITSYEKEKITCQQKERKNCPGKERKNWSESREVLVGR